MPDTFILSVPGKAEYVSTVRLAVSSLAARQGFDIEAIEDIKVAVSEACSNILCHSEIGEERIYRVECAMHADRLEIAVLDEGVGFDAATYDGACETFADGEGGLHAGGLGIYIIKALMDDVQVASKKGEGTCIRMVKRVATPEALGEPDGPDTVLGASGE
jgi:serine/threonine-protein kinase RsbW